ncbi:IS1595 family transposase [Candidatus Uhrbacteria bacterium]|nr:IS1595 family transposase [Candidatus Uhrbacteria bacterium]
MPDRIKRRLLDYFILGVSVYRLRWKHLGNRKTIERFFQIIRAILAIHEGCQEAFGGSVELDESTFGGRRRGKRGWGAAGKIIVFGILKRNGRVKVFPVPKRRKRVVFPLIRKHTKPGSLYFTDDWSAYASLAVRGDHIVVRKEKGRPVGRDHINGIEGFWSYAKHWLYHYRGVHKRFFHLYLGEISYRFNERETDLFPKIFNLLQTTDADTLGIFSPH